jgi:Protein of unknown function (DUF732)
VQQSACNEAGRSVQAGYHSGTATLFIPSLLVAATAAVLLSGCSTTDEITTSANAANRSGAATNPALDGDPLAAPSSSNVSVSPVQHAYLDALTAAGVHQSSDLRALSIGSYVCQARAAGQSDQAVRDFVLPLVRGDADRHPGDLEAPSIDKVAAEYIRIATERLC